MNSTNMTSFASVALAIGACMVVTDTATATTDILRVDGVNGSSTGDGSDWGTDAFDDLQDALDEAESRLGSMSPPDDVQIWVAAATYKPSVALDPMIERTKTFFIDFNNVQLYGGFDGTETTLDERDPLTNVTILSGDIDNDGMLDNDNSFHVVKMDSVDESVVVNGFTIKLGYALFDEGYNFGGGMRIIESNPQLVQLKIQSNYAGAGGGIDIEVNAPTTGPAMDIVNCQFFGNGAQEFGGGLAVGDSYKLTLVNCLFTGNYALNQDGGAGRINGQKQVHFINCTIDDNDADTIGGLSGTNDDIVLSNCIVWNNTDDDNSTDALEEQIDVTTPTVRECCVQDDDPDDASIPFGGASNGNIDDDPEYDMMGTLKYELSSSSPCIDTGANSHLPKDVTDLDDDGIFNERICCDLALNSRVENGGSSLTVDMGVYEY